MKQKWESRYSPGVRKAGADLDREAERLSLSLNNWPLLYIKNRISRGTVAQAYNPNYLRGRDQED
jgi:hypothetical protein